MHENTDPTLTCQIVVDKMLLERWSYSPYLSVGISSDQNLLSAARSRLHFYTPGVVIETWRWSGITNVGGNTFAMVFAVERRFPLPRRENPAEPRWRTNWLRLALSNVHSTSAGVPAILPIYARDGGDIQVTEARLLDHQRGIAIAEYRTNAVVSATIAPAAIAAFDVDKKAADQRARARRLKKALWAAMFCLVLATPVVIALVMRRRT